MISESAYTEETRGTIPSTCSITLFSDSPSSGTTGGGVGELRSARIASSRTHLLSLRMYVIGSVEVELAGTRETSSSTAPGSS